MQMYSKDNGRIDGLRWLRSKVSEKANSDIAWSRYILCGAKNRTPKLMVMLFLTLCAAPKFVLAGDTAVHAAGSSNALISSAMNNNQVTKNSADKPWITDADDQLKTQRALYDRVGTLIQRRQFVEAQELLPELKSYPLFPYLEAELLVNNIRYDNEAVILEFLAAHPRLPAARSLRTEWLHFLRRNNDDSRYLRDYQPQTALSLQCHYLRAQYRTRSNWQRDDEEAFFRSVTEFWIHGRSLPAACDPLFRVWADAGYRTPDVVWQRAELALAANQMSLFRFLNRFLDQDAQQLLEVQRQLRSNPRSVRRFSDIQRARRLQAPSAGQLTTDSLLQSWIIDAIRSLRWNDLESALAAWEHYQTQFTFNSEQINRVHADLAVTMALRGHPEALTWFRKLALDEMSPAVLQWHLATLLRTESFDLINEFIAGMPKSQQQEPQWLYWRARALAELGNNEAATNLYATASAMRNYYGFMASAQMGLPVQLNHQDIALNADILVALSQQPEAHRARELQYHGEHLAARREWNLLRVGQPSAQQVYVAVLASEWGWHDQAIFGLAGSAGVNDVNRRFPLAFADLIQSNAARVDIHPDWVFAIARRESSFQTDAVSPVGARGLLQIMPTTADYLTRGSGTTRSRSNYQLDRPEDNIRLGTQYMAELLNRNDNNWLLATAAYNAGNRRVAEWLPEEPMPADIWVELIPFQETRDYVKAVLAYQQIYALHLGKGANVLAPIVRMRIYNNGAS